MLDLDLIETGAMIHDVGWLGVEISKSIVHGEAGYKWLIENGFLEKLARFCLKHVGVGLTGEEIEKMDMLDRSLDHMPETIEEQVVAYADKFTSKGTNKLYINTSESIDKDMHRYGDTQFQRWSKWKDLFGIPLLENAKKIVDEYNESKRN